MAKHSPLTSLSPGLLGGVTAGQVWLVFSGTRCNLHEVTLYESSSCPHVWRYTFLSLEVRNNHHFTLATAFRREFLGTPSIRLSCYLTHTNLDPRRACVQGYKSKSERHCNTFCDQSSERNHASSLQNLCNHCDITSEPVLSRISQSHLRTRGFFSVKSA